MPETVLSLIKGTFNDIGYDQVGKGFLGLSGYRERQLVVRILNGEVQGGKYFLFGQQCQRQVGVGRCVDESVNHHPVDLFVEQLQRTVGVVQNVGVETQSHRQRQDADGG